MRLVGFLTPIEIEHAILAKGTERKKVVAALTKNGYVTKEIERAIAAAIKNNHLEQSSEKQLGIVSARRERLRRYFLLDMAAIAGKPFPLAGSSASGLVLVPGYGPYRGLKSDELQKAAETRAPSLKTDWSVAGVYRGDLAWLAERGYAVVDP